MFWLGVSITVFFLLNLLLFGMAAAAGNADESSERSLRLYEESNTH